MQLGYYFVPIHFLHNINGNTDIYLLPQPIICILGNNEMYYFTADSLIVIIIYRKRVCDWIIAPCHLLHNTAFIESLYFISSFKLTCIIIPVGAHSASTFFEIRMFLLCTYHSISSPDCHDTSLSKLCNMDSYSCFFPYFLLLFSCFSLRLPHLTGLRMLKVAPLEQSSVRMSHSFLDHTGVPHGKI